MSFSLTDVNTIECDDEVSTDDHFASLQRAINSCMWSLQGSYGRLMMDAVKGGRCLLGTKDCRDAYGNHIPSRDQVQAGTQGSREFVVEHFGADWADQMEAV